MTNSCGQLVSEREIKKPTNLNLRQTIEGMPLAFDPGAAGGLTATMQRDVRGREPGVSHLWIAARQCSFHEGAAKAPKLTIDTPSEVWMAISKGELDGQQAFMRGKYRAEGDFGVLLKLDTLFKTT